MSEISVSMKFMEASGFKAWSSSRKGLAALLERPRMWIWGALAFFVKALRVPIPMPLVAPTKTATRPEFVFLKVALEARTSLMATILKCEGEILLDEVLCMIGDIIFPLVVFYEAG
jgi:hypothetical protein